MRAGVANAPYISTAAHFLSRKRIGESKLCRRGDSQFLPVENCDADIRAEEPPSDGILPDAPLCVVLRCSGRAVVRLVPQSIRGIVPLAHWRAARRQGADNRKARTQRREPARQLEAADGRKT